MMRVSVHPHGCGERMEKEMEDQLITGSSPRLWGTLLFLGL